VKVSKQGLLIADMDTPKVLCSHSISFYTPRSNHALVERDVLGDLKKNEYTVMSKAVLLRVF
jgi:hypothetical protein